MPAYYRSTFEDFLITSEEVVIGKLTNGIEADRFYELKTEAIHAWQLQLPILKRLATELMSAEKSSARWNILLEYPIPRRGKRTDIIIIACDVLIVGEFKMGSDIYTAADKRQTIDYCLDLRDFHLATAGLSPIPLLISTEASAENIDNSDALSLNSPYLANCLNLPNVILQIYQANHSETTRPINVSNWDNSPYHPTPTIIEAAQVLYAHQDVREISHSHAGADNLRDTSQAVTNIIDYARSNNKKVICFITGVPGSGKTLAGLNIVHNPLLQEQEGTIASFMSGNMPLISVLHEALARDLSSRQDMSKEEAKREVSTFIHNIHLYIKEYLEVQTQNAPPDNVIIFDEAQRAWNKEQNLRKWHRDASEPNIILSTMNRHSNWAVVIALIGNGQEIHDGEAGLPEWGRTITEEHSNWEVFISDKLATAGDELNNLTLFKSLPENVVIKTDPRLHLNVALRAYKAEKLSEWVKHVLDGNMEKALACITEMNEYPITLTRSLETAKQWLKSKAQGNRRPGLVASSGARRLRPYGIDVTIEVPVEHWFLNPMDDVRSSSFLELAATEFDIQGLELDWVGVCWDADLRRYNNSWSFNSFKGTKWQSVTDANETRKQFILNKYRVLLTRAREGMIIWIPEGSIDDSTRPASLYDETASYLEQCGAKSIDSENGFIV
ncbi:MAG: DUF2075 domain-containing protein [Kiritimatiellae bacterium]|nr:DUF2075 domain-containing protein [Kiritimatiellia bacterium]